MPSAEFIDSLPFKKIPDRGDFKAFPYQQRLAIWQTVLANSARLAEEFAALVADGKGLQKLRTLAELGSH